MPRVKLGEGIVGYAALHREPVLVSDVSKDPRYIKVVPDVRSELAIPMLIKDRVHRRRRSREPRARRLLASATSRSSRCWPARRQSRSRTRGSTKRCARTRSGWRRSCGSRSACRWRCCPTEPPKRLKGVELAAAFASARELGGDFHDYLAPESNTLVVALGDVSGKGVPAALYSAFAAELVRGRTFRRRYLPERSSPAGVLVVDQHDPAPASARGVLLHALLRHLRPEAALDDAGELGPAVSDSCSAEGLRADRAAWRSARIVCRDRPTTRSTLPAAGGRALRVLHGRRVRSDERAGQEFTAARLLEVVGDARELPAAEIVDAIFQAVADWRGDTPPNDDMTAVAVKISLRKATLNPCA